MTSPNGYVDIHERFSCAIISITDYYHVEVQEDEIDKYIEDLEWAKDKLKELRESA